MARSKAPKWNTTKHFAGGRSQTDFAGLISTFKALAAAYSGTGGGQLTPAAGRDLVADLMSRMDADADFRSFVILVLETLGHRDLATTQIYADYAPSSAEAEMVAAAFARTSYLPQAPTPSDIESRDAHEL